MKKIDDIKKYEHPSDEVIKFQDEFLKKQMDEIIERVNKIGTCKHTFDDGIAIGGIIAFTCIKCGWSYRTLYVDGEQIRGKCRDC